MTNVRDPVNHAHPKQGLSLAVARRMTHAHRSVSAIRRRDDPVSFAWGGAQGSYDVRALFRYAKSVFWSRPFAIGTRNGRRLPS